ncbi:Uncharacterised protein [uncultured archaeon]|nr:Uncharacterised protein [uncultured archaeon]
MKKKPNAFLLIRLLLIASAGIATAHALTKAIDENKLPQHEPTTRFYAISEGQIFFGKPVLYDMILENHEGKSMDYKLQVRLSGETIYNKEITLNDSETLNQTISFIPDQANDYQRLEFLLFKDNVPYRTRVFQFSPSIDYSMGSNIITVPIQILNGNMETDSGWEFEGKEFTGNYTTYDWSSPKHSYQIKTSHGVKRDSFGSIFQNFSSEQAGMASLSFDVKTNNPLYHTQVLVNDKIVWDNSSEKEWQRSRVAVFLKKSNRIELKIIAKNDTKSGVTAWLDTINFESYSPEIKNETIKNDAISYNKQINRNIIVYKFNTGEKLELKVVKGNVSNGDALYVTGSKGNNIIFLGETYEKSIIDEANNLYPIILDSKDRKLKVNETLKLDNGYAITLIQIRDESFKLSVSLNGRIVRIILIAKNSSAEYWKETDGYKKEKVLKIFARSVYQDEIDIDIVQYGKQKMIKVGNQYGEFQVTNLKDDSIVMKNVQAIEMKDEDISLMGGKIIINGGS